MNVRIFARFLIGAALLIAGYGVATISTNQPETFDQSKSRPGVLGGRDDVSNWLGVQQRNLARKQKCDDAKKVIVAGGLVLFLGVALAVASGKPGGRTSGAAPLPGSHGYCPACGQQVASAHRFCQACGAKVT